MATAFRPRTAILFVGDVFFFTFALWLTLFLRAFELPQQEQFLQHLAPFALLFIVWVVVYFIAGLYESRTLLLARRAVSETLLIAQIINICLAALFFFFIPVFGITPKVVLFIYLVVSFLSVLIWRTMLFPWLGLQKAEKAIVVGSGAEIDELVVALQAAHRAPVQIAKRIEPGVGVAGEVERAIAEHRARFVIADFNHPSIASAFPKLYNFLSQGIRFFDAKTLYEEVFGRVPLSVLDERWMARNVSRYAHLLYDPIKRLTDIVIGVLGGLLSLIFYPFIVAAIFVEDGGSIFIKQKRVGQDGRIIYIHKFRSMQRNDMELSTHAPDNKVTRAGGVLRRLRLDELPQLWDVVRGELSLIGPRPELPAGVILYEKEIPYYGVRHLIKPGLSGWAQLYHDNHPHHQAQVQATREKLSYDLYYLKHRSLALDAIIALKTFKKLLTRSGV